MYPILFQSPNLTIYAYPLMMGLGWGVAYQIFFAHLPQDIPRRYAQILYWGIFLFAWIGAKALFYLTLDHPEARALATSFSFWTGGGFVFYGGFLGGLVFLLLYRLLRLPLNRSLLWSFLPALTIGHAIGRIGCALAGCCFGEVTNWWWGIHLHGHDRHPTQILESAGLFLLGTYLMKSSKPKLQLVSHYLLGYGFLRFGMEMLRGDVIRGLWGILTPSQWISLLLITGGISLWLKLKISSRYSYPN